MLFRKGKSDLITHQLKDFPNPRLHLHETFALPTASLRGPARAHLGLCLHLTWSCLLSHFVHCGLRFSSLPPPFLSSSSKHKVHFHLTGCVSFPLPCSTLSQAYQHARWLRGVGCLCPLLPDLSWGISPLGGVGWGRDSLTEETGREQKKAIQNTCQVPASSAKIGSRDGSGAGSHRLRRTKGNIHVTEG